MRRSSYLKSRSLVALLVLFCFTGSAPAQVLAPHAKELSSEFEEIAKRVSPTVVHIATETVVKTRGMQNPFGELFDDEQFRKFFQFPQQPEREYRQRGLGSGVIISDDGYILSNNHVVEGVSKVRIVLSDEREFEAEVVGTDPETDIAVLKIKGQDFPVAELGDSNDLKVGHFVLAIGNPFGLDRTVSCGIISGKGRSNVGITEYEDFIQTDAAINPGNSGGPIVDMDGKVVGINSAILSRTGGSLGIGFAIPINMAERIMNIIIKEGSVTRGWLGVNIQELTPDLAEALELEDSQGALVADVLPDTPAEEAGLQTGDVIVALDGEKVEGVTELRNKVSALEPDQRIKVEIVREGKRRNINVTIGKKASAQKVAEVETETELGFQVRDLTDELKSQYQIGVNQGVVVVSVDGASAAAAAGITPGMVIQGVNREKVRNIEEFKKAVADTGKGDKLLLLVNYKNVSRYILLKPE